MGCMIPHKRTCNQPELINRHRPCNRRDIGGKSQEGDHHRLGSGRRHLEPEVTTDRSGLRTIIVSSTGGNTKTLFTSTLMYRREDYASGRDTDGSRRVRRGGDRTKYDFLTGLPHMVTEGTGDQRVT